MSTRTQVSYLSPSLSQPPPPPRRKLRKEERDRGGNVLPSGVTGYGQTNGNDPGANGTGYGRPEGTPRHHHLAPRLQIGRAHV